MSDIIVELLILFGCVALTGGTVLLMRKPLHKQGGILLAFSGAYLLGFCVTHLLPYIFHSDLGKPGLWILGGFLIQILLEFVSEGVEHGHFHYDEGNKKFPWVILIGLCLHAYFEGMPFGADTDHQHSLLLGIVLHKVPVALVLSGMFLQAGFSLRKSMLLLLMFAAMSPLGAVSYVAIEGTDILAPEIIAPAVNALLVGILLHVATTILFESGDGHRFNLLKVLIIIAGLGLAYLS